MSLQDLLESAFTTLQTNNMDPCEFGNLKGAIHQVFNSNNRNWSPLIDMFSDQDFLYIYGEMPGVKEDSIDVEFFNNKISISGEKIKNNLTDLTFIKNEIGYGKFTRTLILPMNVSDKKNVSITYSNGMLCVKVNKKSEELNKFHIKLE